VGYNEYAIALVGTSHKRESRVGEVAVAGDLRGQYPMLSWYVHSGITGVVNLDGESFTVLCGVAFQIVTEAYRELLLAVIGEFKIAKADEKIEGKLEVARYLPFTDTPEQVETVVRHFTK
jgi:hypothetical protein